MEETKEAISSHGAPSSAVIVVSSHVVRGSVGNRASVFALETLRRPVWAVPTIILPWHPGHGRASRIVPPPQEFAALMHDLEEAPWLNEVGAVLSGYLGHAEQAEAIVSLVGAVKARNPQALYVCDPIMGDEGGLYVPETTASAIRDRLVPLADLVTPNRFEFGWLTGRLLETTEDVVLAASRAGPSTMLITSVPSLLPGSIANLLLSPEGVRVAEHPAVARPAKGPGDLMTALMTGWLLRGVSPADALQRSTAAVFEVLARAAARGSDELMLETDAAALSAPSAHVKMRSMPRP